MCLIISKKQKVKTAKKDIVVYKHLIKYGDVFKTSYQKAEVKLGETYTSEFSYYPYWDNNKMITVQEGLHSYKNVEDARSSANNFNETLVECIIPKGSKYYLGKFDVDDAECYASDTLTYVRIIEYYH